MIKIPSPARSIYSVALIVFCAVVIFYFPVLTSKFAYHNDYRIFTYDVSDCCLGYPETKHLLGVGRPILAILLNVQLLFISSMFSLQLMHFVSVVMIATAASILFLHLLYFLNISRLSAALLSFIIFTSPSMAINSFWVTNICSEILPIFAVIFAHYLISKQSKDGATILIVFIIILLNLFIYPPSTLFFASLIFIKFLFGEANTKNITLRNITLELFLVLSACITYFLIFKYIIKPMLVNSAFGGFDFLEYYAFIDANYSIYDFSIFSNLDRKADQLIDLFNLACSLWLPQPSEVIWDALLITILFMILVSASSQNVYMRRIRSVWRMPLVIIIYIFIACLTALPIMVSSSEFEIPFRAIFSSMVIIPSIILYAFDRFLVGRRRDRIYAYKLIVFILVISAAEAASFYRLILVVDRATTEYNNVLDAVKNDVFVNEKIVRVSSTPTALSQKMSAYLSRDFNLIGMNVSLDGIINAAANDLGLDLKGYKIETDLLGPRYDARLSEGIIFSRDGEPRFIKSFKGISGRENVGRWTDGNEVVIEFLNPLPRMFTLRIKAGASNALVGVPFDIVVGESRREAKFVSPEATEIEVPIATNGTTSSIVFQFKTIKSPFESGLGADNRHLGLALVSLYVE
jgi:hypothetical protein